MPQQNRYMRRELHRRQYTFTKTKALIAFLASCVFSIVFGNYFDRYGPWIYAQTKDVLVERLGLGAEAQAATKTRSTRGRQVR